MEVLKKTCPRCKGLGITYFVMEGPGDCSLCNGKRFVRKRSIKKWKKNRIVK